MPNIKETCSECHKQAIEVYRFKLNGDTKIILKCGHIYTEEKIEALKEDEFFFESMDGHRPFAYQKENAQFAIDAGGRALFADEPGLGKTISAFLTISRLGADALPVLWVVKSALIPQFFTQIIKWLGFEHIAQCIEKGTDKPFKGFKHYIISYDLLHRMPENAFENVGIQTVVLDECQMIKSFAAKRTKAVFKTASTAKYLIALSGTPILNNAVEYFPVLHLLRPRKFPHRDSFIRYWIKLSFTNKPIGLRNPEQFKDYTKDFIIRHKKSEVLKDLPKLTRGFEYMNMDDDLVEAHDKIVKEFGDAYSIDPNMDAPNILAWMSKMRHVTGLAKIENTVNLAIEHLENTERQLVIFVHHIDVGDIIHARLVQWARENNQPMPLRFTGGMGADEIAKLTTSFANGSRIIVGSTLAMGEGLNLQSCSDCILHEREWNPPKEDQAFDRFHRIGQLNPVSARITIALGSIDETFNDIVEGKRSQLKQALDNEEYKWNDTSLAREMADAMLKRSFQLQEKKLKAAGK